MSRLYLDHNVSTLLGAELTHLGHDVQHSQACGLGRASGATHLSHAADERRVLITNDRNFLALQAAWMEWPPRWRVQPPPEHAGILLVRESDMGPSAAAARIVDAHSRQHTHLANVLWRWMRSPGWFIP